MKKGNLLDDIIENAKKYCSDYSKVNPDGFQQAIFGLLDLSRAEYQLLAIENDLKTKLEYVKILEVGTGLGSFLIAAREKGIDCYGVEPNEYGAKTAIKRMPELRTRIRIGVGEDLPYESGTFDLVVSFQVLEHTQNPQKVLHESIRVLKKGGFLYFVIPNYNSFWEGHYGLYWLPRFPKSLAKLYLRLRGRDPKFLDSIRYITPKLIEKTLKDKDIEVLSFGVEKWKERLDSLNFSTWGSTEKLKQVAKLIHKLKIVSVIKFLGEKLEFYYPIILIVKKK